MATEFSLKPLDGFAGRSGPLLLVVMDGVGLGRRDEGNAVWCAKTPVLDALQQQYLNCSLRAHGTAVGLPSDGDMGNSEVGHNALGSGRVFAQGAKLVNQAIKTGAIFEGKVWQELVQTVKTNGTALHFIGLLSDGNVHSHIEQLMAMISRADQDGVEKVFIHALLDGRDVPETSALTYVSALEGHLAPIDQRPDRSYKIASGGGRMFVTMDRYEADWRIVERGFATHVRGEGRTFGSAQEAIETYRSENPKVIDQDLPPFVIGDSNGPLTRIEDGHGVVFFNFRGDRALEISRAFEQEHFDKFDRGPRLDLLYAGMMQYDGDLQIPKKFLVEPPNIERTMSQYLVHNQVPQLAISETQKYGHVTYFWNGNRSGKFEESLEEYIEIPSDRVSFDTTPRMQADAITERLIAELRSNKYRFLRVNYANGDMVGHTGVRTAAIEAVEAVDQSLGRLLEVVKALNGVMLVTADHGNSDEMYEWDKKKSTFKTKKDGSYAAKTAHTLNPVPFVVVDPNFDDTYRLASIENPGLANVAATVFNLLGYQAPEDYEPSLLQFG